MTSTINTYTGNPIVDALGQMNFSGNIIPEAWYYTIVNEKGKTSLLSIIILADIVYWYRPTEIRDEQTNSVTLKKKFSDKDFLQRSYAQICSKFNVSTKQAREAIKLLEDLGVIKRHFRNIMTSHGPCSNVMYLELFPTILKKLTYPDQNSQNGKTSFPKGKDTPTILEEPFSVEGKTNTKTTTEITTKETTTLIENKESIVGEVNEIFKDLGLSEKDLCAIANASSNDLGKCKQAREILDQQKRPVNNVVGWIIEAIREGYVSVTKNPSTAANSFNNFPQRKYDYDALERKLLGL